MSTKSKRGDTCIALDQPDTDNATHFLADDVDKGEYWPADFLYLHKRTHFAYLKDFNEGCRNGPKRYNDPLVTREAGRDLIDALSGQLDMTSTQRNHVQRYFTNLDRGELGLRLELVGYCLCMVIVEQDEQNQHRRCHPNVPDRKKDDLFQSLANSLNLTEREIRKTYGKLQHVLRSTPVPPETEPY